MVNGLFRLSISIGLPDGKRGRFAEIENISSVGKIPQRTGEYPREGAKKQCVVQTVRCDIVFKIAILQSLCNPSGDEIEYQIMDQLSFMRFLNLDMDSRIPDAKTIWRFRARTEEHQLTRKLFNRFNGCLNESGFEVRKGQIVNATIVLAPTQRNSEEENPTIKACNPPVAHWSKAKQRQKDTDVRWTQKHNQSYFGYKNHGKIRSRIEHVFGTMRQCAGMVILLTIGIARAEVKLWLRNLAYNIDRFCAVKTQTV